MIEKHKEYYIKVGKCIKNKRVRLGLTQEQLAQKIPKMDRAKISDMENAKEDYHFSTLLNICEALEATLDEILNQEVDR